MTILGVIPARLASSRLPEKMLADINGKPLIVHTLESAKRASLLDELIVATDSMRIHDEIVRVGGKAVMTSAELPSGSDRVLAASETAGNYEIIVNIQGDEPLLPPDVIDGSIALLLENPRFDVTTASEPLQEADRTDPNAVKVVAAQDKRALYFSRSLVPYPRNPEASTGLYYRHIGLYVFRRAALEAFCSWPPSPLEQCEGLEQLRMLEHGLTIGVARVDSVPPGVDTAEDLSRIKKLLAKE